MSRILLSLVGLTLIYAFTLASFHPWDLAMGAVLSGLVLVMFRRFLFGAGRRGDAEAESGPALWERLIWFSPMAAAIVGDIVRGTWQVALIVLHLRPIGRPGIVKIPIGNRTRTGVAVTSLATTLSPGSFLVDIDWQEAVMLFHVIDASDPDDIRASFERFYERWQRHVAP